MKGIILGCITEMIIEKFGESKLSLILKASQFEHKYKTFLPVEDVPDAEIMTIISVACKELGMTIDELGDAFGEYWCLTYGQRIYAPYFKNATDAKEFLMQVKSIHNRVTRTINNAKPPHFDYIDVSPNRLIMKYSSHRNLQAIWLGCIKGVGLVFKEKLELNIIDANTVEIIFHSKEKDMKENKN